MKADGYPDIDPWVVDWFDENGAMMDRPEEYTPEVLAMMRPTAPQPPTTDVGTITDEVIAGVPVYVYEPPGEPTGIVVYFHGGGFVGGSRWLMHNVAKGSPGPPERWSCRSSTGWPRRTPTRQGWTTPRP